MRYGGTVHLPRYMSLGACELHCVSKELRRNGGSVSQYRYMRSGACGLQCERRG